MKRFLSLGLCLAMVATASLAFATTSGPVYGDNEELQIVIHDPSVVITSTSSSLALAARETAGPDTFYIYGGPDEVSEGKFEVGGLPDWGGWTPKDITDQDVYWHQDTFNAANLDPAPGNHALWSGIPAGDPRSDPWVNNQGYGNGWNDAVLWESGTVVDPLVGQTVTLDFFFNHDTEGGYDYLVVQYDSAGTWTEVFAIDGTNHDLAGVFPAPGVQYSLQSPTPIFFAGGDYGGDNGDQIRLKILVTSDGAWSDQDGLNPTFGGAAQIDNVVVSTSLGTTATETFEGPGPYQWLGDKSPFVGDFAEIYPRMTDIDPCRDNLTPIASFVDAGQIIRNGPGLNGLTQIVGGSTSPNWTYGIIGNYVTNYSGGLSLGEAAISNEIWSPDILWDYPGTNLDDDVAVSGAFIRWTIWQHLPLDNAMFYVWHVRSALAGEGYNEFADLNFVYYGGGVSGWFNQRQDVTKFLQAGPERVSFALGTVDMSLIWTTYSGNDATPSPAFDNLAFVKYKVGGPAMTTREIDLANDGFPANGSIDVSSQGARDLLDIKFDMARDISVTAQLNPDSGDSIIVDVVNVIPGASISDIRMFWALNTNPLFETAIRAAPGRVKDMNVSAPAVEGGGVVWTGEVMAVQSRTSAGFAVKDRFEFDLPDVDFIYPGDVLHYYIQATDSGPRVTTFPAVVDGFGAFGPTATYNRGFIVRGLPTITGTELAPVQPEILVINGMSHRAGSEASWTTAMRQLGYGEGVDFDTYNTSGPTSGVSNSIGATGEHGANAGQLGGYHHILYLRGNLETQALSDGTNIGTNDKANDLAVLEAWHSSDPGVGGFRNMAYFGDYIATAMKQDSAEALSYLGNTMGVAWVDRDVRDFIDNQTAAVVVPSGIHTQFGTDFVAYGGCLVTNEFDHIQPLVGASAGHYFTDPNGVPYTDLLGGDGVASVVNPTTYGLDITFPFASYVVYDIAGSPAGGGKSARTWLFDEIFSLFSAGAGSSPIVSAPSFRKAELSIFPNPFNPSTLVKFSTTVGAKGSVKVFNLRGELVRTLHTGVFTQVDGFSKTWDGTDNRGASVASGVYVIKAVADGQVQTAKAALVK